jgi:hypothetical protein
MVDPNVVIHPRMIPFKQPPSRGRGTVSRMRLDFLVMSYDMQMGGSRQVCFRFDRCDKLL